MYSMLSVHVGNFLVFTSVLELCVVRNVNFFTDGLVELSWLIIPLLPSAYVLKVLQ